MKGGIIHLHQRKRIHQHHQKYPHPDPRIRFLDKLVSVVAFIAPLTTLPQMYTIWIERNAAGISVVTWFLYTLFSIPLLVYGIVHKAKPLIVMYALWTIVNLSVAIGALLYGG